LNVEKLNTFIDSFPEEVNLKVEVERLVHVIPPPVSRPSLLFICLSPPWADSSKPLMQTLLVATFAPDEIPRPLS